ncbi:MAG TPA: hemerythrin domain-containing protein [Bryobacteraceae bacterium]|nr:hemerythrin domain-containing protein [Bryobacteraceae bacterium]
MPVAVGTAENTFANPIGLLADCHRRIERSLQALLTVATQVEGGHLDPQHRSALATALEYFRQAAPKHTVDEEEDLFPMLRQLASPRISKIAAEVDRLEGEHKTAGAWHREVEDICERWLRQDHLSGKEAAHLSRLLDAQFRSGSKGRL